MGIFIAISAYRRIMVFGRNPEYVRAFGLSLAECDLKIDDEKKKEQESEKFWKFIATRILLRFTVSNKKCLSNMQRYGEKSKT